MNALRRANVLGVEIDRMDMRQTLDAIERRIAQRDFAQHVAINASKVIQMERDPQMREIVRRCEIVSADGQSVVWASRVLGDPLPERVAGIDLMNHLLALAERRGWRVFILGASRDVLGRAEAVLRRRHPDLVLAGTRDGYFGDEEAGAVAQQVRDARPDILFVAISSPRKEYWLGRYGREIGVPFVMGVGGSVDVLAGVTQRAPGILQVTGLEWAYRLAQEPRRLWRRYAVTNGRFVGLVVRAVARRAAGSVRPR